MSFEEEQHNWKQALAGGGDARYNSMWTKKPSPAMPSPRKLQHPPAFDVNFEVPNTQAVRRMRKAKAAALEKIKAQSERKSRDVGRTRRSATPANLGAMSAPSKLVPPQPPASEAVTPMEIDDYSTQTAFNTSMNRVSPVRLSRAPARIPNTHRRPPTPAVVRETSTTRRRDRCEIQSASNSEEDTIAARVVARHHQNSAPTVQKVKAQLMMATRRSNTAAAPVAFLRPTADPSLNTQSAQKASILVNPATRTHGRTKKTVRFNTCDSGVCVPTPPSSQVKNQKTQPQFPGGRVTKAKHRQAKGLGSQSSLTKAVIRKQLAASAARA